MVTFSYIQMTKGSAMPGKPGLQPKYQAGRNCKSIEAVPGHYRVVLLDDEAIRVPESNVAYATEIPEKSTLNKVR